MVVSPVVAGGVQTVTLRIVSNWTLGGGPRLSVYYTNGDGTVKHDSVQGFNASDIKDISVAKGTLIYAEAVMRGAAFSDPSRTTGDIEAIETGVGKRIFLVSGDASITA